MKNEPDRRSQFNNGFIARVNKEIAYSFYVVASRFNIAFGTTMIADDFHEVDSYTRILFQPEFYCNLAGRPYQYPGRRCTFLIEIASRQAC